MSVTSRVIRNARRRGVKVHSRLAWGNTSSVYVLRRTLKKHAKLPSDTLWQHITVTDPPNFKQGMRDLHKIGMERFGSGISYNFVIDPKTGEVGLGQALDAKGTHTINDKGIAGYSHDQNFVSHAVAVMGMPGVTFTQKAFDALADLIAAMIEEGALTKGHDYNPHSMVAAKECPTQKIRDLMPAIHKEALRRVSKR